jgi:hypothetical protein
VGGNRQHRNMVAMTVKQTVNQMQVTRPAGAGADGQLAGQLRFRACGKAATSSWRVGIHSMVPILLRLSLNPGNRR